jgi:hypothetical protein
MDALINSFMTGSLSHDEFFRRYDELFALLPPREKAVVNAMADLCVALQQRDDLAKKAEEFKHGAQAAQLQVEQLKEKVETLLQPETLSKQTLADIQTIEQMQLADSKMVWFYERTYQDQWVFCQFKKKKLPKFSDPSENVIISIDDETKFICIQKSPETWAVFGNSEGGGKVVGVHKGSMTW